MRIVKVVVVGAVAWSSSMATRGEGFSYLDFAAPTSLIFQADALPTNSACRLTPSAKSKVGGVWFERQLVVGAGFETTFQFQITNPGQYGADGLAFVIQSNVTPSLGKPGWQLGFGGISNSLVVKFDNYHWRDKIYRRYDEIAVSVCGESGDCDPDTNAAASVTRDVLFSDGKIHTARIRYQPGQLQVHLDDYREPILRTAVTLPPAFGAEAGEAWAGFTAATGADYQTHDILSWTFFSKGSGPFASQALDPRASAGVQLPTPSPAAARMREFSGASQEPEATSTARTPSSVRGPTMLTLPLGRSFPWRVEASTNLVDWEAVTNITFHFSDPDTTRFNQRFYRVFEQ
jgi:hypothetical protein